LYIKISFVNGLWQNRQGSEGDSAEGGYEAARERQDELVVIGESASDPAGAAAREGWIKDLGLWYDEPTAAADWLDVVGPRTQRVESHFNAACCRLAGTLHASGAITRALGRPVPVLIHELEYYEQIAVRTKRATHRDSPTVSPHGSAMAENTEEITAQEHTDTRNVNRRWLDA
jgi:hypothetical protein